MASGLKTRAEIVAKIDALEKRRAEEEARLKSLTDAQTRDDLAFLKDKLGTPESISKRIEGYTGEISKWQDELKQFPAHTAAPVVNDPQFISPSSPQPSAAETVEQLKHHGRFLVSQEKFQLPDYVQALSELLKEGAELPGIDINATKEAPNQLYLHNLMNTLDPKKVRSVLVAEAKNPKETLSRLGHQLLPDGPIYSGHLLNEKQGMIAVIEAKAPDFELGDTQQVQIFNYLDAILFHQPERRYCYGALWNGRVVKLFKAERSPDQRHASTKRPHHPAEHADASCSDGTAGVREHDN